MKSAYKTIPLLLALTLVAGLLAPAAWAVPEAAPPRLQPALAALVTEAPEKVVRVIVQKADDTGRAEARVERLGGLVVKDLPIINAFAARLSARLLPDLARQASVNRVTLDAPLASAGRPTEDPCAAGGCPDNFYIDTLNVQPVWDLGFHGEGIGVVIIDSGIFKDRDFTVTPGKPFSRVNVQISFNADNVSDTYGHGTHVAGIAGGNGSASQGFYSGIAPKIDLINLKVSDDFGMAYESDTVDAMQWVLENKDTHNIRVVNLSINSTIEQSYHESPLNAAAEILWFNGVVVVASAGNQGPGGGFNTVNAAPANDPFIITVGASDENGTVDRSNDIVTPFSAFGVTSDGYVKPDIIAPGKDIISVLASASDWASDYPDRAVLDQEYFRVSGTSMAAPMVTGAVALLLQAEPDLTPDQVKYRLAHASTTIQGSSSDPNSYPYLDIYAAVTSNTTASANQDVVPHMLLAKMAMMAYWSSENGGENIDWENVDWAAVNWNAVNWNAVNWNSVNWNAVDWDSVDWDGIDWSSVNWNSVNWNSVNWNSVNWNSVNWNSVNWNAVNWNSVDFDY